MQGCVQRKLWGIDFAARPDEVAAIRRLVRVYLRLWGLMHLTDSAELVVSELVTNVIRHVGLGARGRLTVTMRDGALRFEVQDPSGEAMPHVVRASEGDEGGRGLRLIEAIADSWGVVPTPTGKAVWAELDAGVDGPYEHAGGDRVDKAEALLTLYRPRGTGTAMSTAVMAEVAVDLLADLLHWLSAHGCDPDEAIDRAQMHFKAEQEAGC